MSTISLVTVCKGRLYQLKETFPRNLHWNRSHPNIEFVLLDYTSEDGMQDWVKKYYSNEIESGILNYYWYPDAPFFQMSHSKNLASRLAQGEIICNIDADNYTGKGFAQYIDGQINDQTFLVGCEVLEHNRFEPKPYNAGSSGRVAVPKKAYLRVGGYDEQMNNWGFDDRDFYRRLGAMGYKAKSIAPYFLACIEHNDEERIKNLSIFDKSESQVYYSSTILRNSINTYSQLSEKNISEKNFVANSGIFGCG